MEKGFTRVHPLEGGLDAWTLAGHFAEDETIVAIRRRR
jgi:rhodanese-related sulfurtransferase